MNFTKHYLPINKETEGLGKFNWKLGIILDSFPLPFHYGPEKTASSISLRLREYLNERWISS